ncbi:cystatin-A-like [Hyperolius riggenbachi]|uniref:cystatin-A-like n=1 Tax=Hyperolius riggenbachi TaxID=752182 RepID=UPI0035A3B876
MCDDVDNRPKQPKPHMVGGFGKAKQATPEVQEICDSVRPDFEKKSGVNCGNLTAILYRTQVVAGTIYLIKVTYGDNKCAHLKVFKPLPQTDEPVSLQDFKLDKTEEDELEP